jgi:beta-lactam-binding protein with PASTA domain
LPDLVGTATTKATQELTALGLSTSVVVTDSTAEPDTVVAMTPAAGTPITTDIEVTLEVSAPAPSASPSS